MIESLSIRHFKVLREVDLALTPLTAIVGPNASGKSSILEAIAVLLDPAKLSKAKGRARLRSRNSQEGPLISAVIDGSRREHDLSKSDGSGIRGKDLHLADDDDMPIVRPWHAVLLDLDPRKLAAPSYPKHASLRLPSDGEGLPSLLAGLKLEKPDRFTQIIDRLRSVVPNLKDVRIRRIALDTDKIGDEILFDMLGAEGIPASDASHGTLLTLGILSALAIRARPQVVLIDDLERGLHPKALACFIQQLRGLQDPQLQIVATSHSPYLVDCMSAEEVLLTSLDEDGYAVARSLSGHPEYERWKNFMAPGEFWSSVGEDWITKNKKATA